MTVKLIKVVENNLYDAGKFIVDLSKNFEQITEIINKVGKSCGRAVFNVQSEIMERDKR